MKQIALFASILVMSSAAYATDVNLSVRVTGGSNTVTVEPGATVDYEVVAELSDAANEGLAYFRFDASFDGGPLSKAAEPTSPPMLNFVAPAGWSNPAGLGGTATNGVLVQIGGAQNTINNSFASAPIGAVITGLAKPGNPVVLVKGSLTAPMFVGTYTLSLSDIDANVIRQGETGFPFWACDKAGTGNVSDLSVKVSALDESAVTVSASAPTPVALNLHGGQPWKNRQYVLLGTARGTMPGVGLGNGLVLPINPDAYTNYTISFPNSAILANNVGTTNGLGQATATLSLPPSVSPAAIGLQISHAWMTSARDFASDAVTVTVVP